MSETLSTPTIQRPMHKVNLAILPGDIIFDVGANIGDKAEAFLSTGARVVCVEPQPACVDVLVARFAENPNVSVVPKGLGNKVGLLEMNINTKEPVLSTFSNEWMSGRFKSEVWDQKVEIAITTLDNVILEYGTPRYLKIDVEGFEFEVISGLSKRVGIISVEFTNEFIGNSLRILKYLHNIGYRRFNFSVGEQLDFFLPQWIEITQFSELIADLCQKHNLLWGDIYAN
jgi:FkbM family methyltransferase